MEEILASIKRIIADDGPAVPPTPKPRAARPTVVPKAEKPESFSIASSIEEEEPLELTNAMPFDASPAEPAPEPVVDEPKIISDDTAAASRGALAALSAMVVKPEGPATTLDGLVRDMLRPMLKEWLDAQLPEIVERMVSREIARITGNSV